MFRKISGLNRLCVLSFGNLNCLLFCLIVVQISCGYIDLAKFQNKVLRQYDVGFVIICELYTRSKPKKIFCVNNCPNNNNVIKIYCSFVAY